MKKVKLNKMPKLNLSNYKKVSVIIPNYNYEEYIIDRITSVINQTYPIYELIILDDCSTDNSVSIIKKHLSKIKIKNKLIVNENNSGCVFSQWKNGIDNVTGDYFWIAEADDLADPKFLENVMKGFDNKNVVISYCESARINENGFITSADSRDWSDIFSTGFWDKDFVISGEDAVKNLLSYTNTILNVSSVVWKKMDFSDVLEEAKKFKVAGDWYIYYKTLLKGDLSYCAKSLNYYRKHSKSVTTNIKSDLEFQEIIKIQNEINSIFPASKEIKYKQNIRLNFMKESVNRNNQKILKDFKRHKIAFVIPYPVKGSGGHRTIIQNANALVNYGYEVDIYVEEDYVSTSSTMKQMIEEYYGSCKPNVYVGLKMRDKYDLVFATAWTTAEAVRNIESPKKAYFIQDYEPWFEPMGYSYIVAENSYKYGFKFITIGRWLANKISKEFNQPAKYFNFCADLNSYYYDNSVKKENAICFIYQPEKWRRCSKLGTDALKIVQNKYPDLKIYLYGSFNEGFHNLNAENLHVISVDECRKLYNKCKIGLCISASNPSRIPFEMMACGLPVVDLYRENNIYDMPSNGVSLAESNPEAIASAILDIYENESKAKKMSEFGIKYMKEYDLKVGYNQFIEAVDKILNDNFTNQETIEPLYSLKGVTGRKEYEFKVNPNIPALYTANTSARVRKLVKIKRKLKSKLKKIIPWR